MTNAGTVTARKQWTVVALLALSAVINYVDRGSLSVAAPALTVDLHLSPHELGVLLSAFFWTYAAFQIFAGWLIDRFPVMWVFSAGFFIWAAATFASGFAGSLASLIVLRMCLGAGESVAFPSYSKVIAAGFPPERRGLPNALVEAGTKLGPAFGTLIGGLLVARYGWRALFLGMGAGSLLWLIPWLIWAPRPSHAPVVRAGANTGANAPASKVARRPGMWDILVRRDAWGTFLGNACYTYAYYFLLTWLPSYLVKERHVSMTMMGILGSVPFWGAAAAAVVSGAASDAWIRRGGSLTRVRKTFVAGGLLLSTVMIGSVMARDLTLSIVLLSIAYVAFGIMASNHWAITQTLAGQDAVGLWSGMQNTLGSLSGVVAPIVTGYIVEGTGSFFWAFVSPAVLAAIGACSYLFLVGEVAPIDWGERLDPRNPMRKAQ